MMLDRVLNEIDDIEEDSPFDIKPGGEKITSGIKLTKGNGNALF